jgi:hypothetical protein
VTKKGRSGVLFLWIFPLSDNKLFAISKKMVHTSNPGSTELWSDVMKIFMSNRPQALMFPAQSAHVLIVAALAAFAALLGVSAAHAQDRIYRCAGNEYTNNATTAAERGCKLVEGGNLTVVSAPKARAPSAGNGDVRVASATTSANPAPSRIDTAEQRSRDSDSRAILESELKKVEAKQAELLKEFNNGEPEKRGDEMRNNQKYLDRTAELKAQIARNDSDIAGIKREIGRTQPSSASR